jgi:Viral BACON domain/Putative binding domain, N-terminal
MRKKSSIYFALLMALGSALSACEKSSPTAPTPPACTYTLSTATLAFGASGGSGSVNVTTASHCVWTAASDRGWMTITSGTSGTGSGVVNVSLTANTSEAVRTGTLTIAGQSVAVQEEGLEACTVDISPTSASYNEDGASGSFAVTAPAHCQWTAASNSAWLVVTGGSPGNGHGTVAYSVDRNREINARTATIVVGERTFTLHQSGDTPPPSVCEYSVTPIDFSPCMSTPYDLTATITTQQGCTWTASPAASWMTVTGGHTGSGPGIVSFRVSDNWDPPRQGVVMVRWPTATAGQNLQVAQAGCYYSVSSTAISIAAAGGTGRFDVIQQSDPISCGGATQDRCLWTAQADVPWIAVTTSMPQTGDNPVLFSVAANPGSAARTGTIVVRDRVVQITQSGQ